MLITKGFQVQSVSTAEEALMELNEKPVTFLLTDIGLPEMDGLELIRRASNDHNHVCSIAMTGYAKEYKYMDVVNAGATDFINKPFGIEELEAKIRRAMIERNIKEELNKLSITDALTGLYNQRHFYAKLKDEITRAQRQNRSLGLILIDLDDFKAYNDSYGHIAGDEILQKVGNIIITSIREFVDSGYRYGGDEFAIILIDTDRSVSKSIGTRVGVAIEKECNLTASMGYANFSNGMESEAFFNKADKDLYSAKAARRNEKERILNLEKTGR
jgi:diguanylate cyclase (GGDEF)-like protein